jgi:tRNA (guanine9-N1)-methyltransferase
VHYKEPTAENKEPSQYLELSDKLPKEKLVYLTADSENLIDELDSSKIYIIGGIVDHNRHKLLTYSKALKQGIAHGRLPIRESGVQLTTSCVLAVNHVMDIIARYHSLGGGKSLEVWKQALEEAIPERKRAVLKKP